MKPQMTIGQTGHGNFEYSLFFMVSSALIPMYHISHISRTIMEKEIKCHLKTVLVVGVFQLFLNSFFMLKELFWKPVCFIDDCQLLPVYDLFQNWWSILNSKIVWQVAGRQFSGSHLLKNYKRTHYWTREY